MLNRFKRLVRRAPAVIALSIIPLAAQALPADAAVVSGGTITGVVSLSGIDTQADGIINPCPATSYTFLSTTLQGAVSITIPTVPPRITDAIGTFNVTASGGSSGECGMFGQGTVNVNGCSGTATIVTQVPPGSISFGGAVSCSGLTGTFTRVGAVVIITMGGGTVCVGTTCGAVSLVVMAAVGVPNPLTMGPCPGNATHTCFYDVTFAGGFTAAGT